MSIDQDAQHLALADKHIEDAEARIDAQRKVVAHAEKAGHEYSDSLKLLEAMEEAMRTMLIHRRQILERIGAVPSETPVAVNDSASVRPH
jgi:hypothetical protein